MPDKVAGKPSLHALLIAADRYLPNRFPEGAYASLKGCVRDVQHVADFLKNRLGMADGQIFMLTSTNNGAAEPPEPVERRPTYANMVSAFKDLAGRAGSGDQVYIHYSGHGGRTPTSIPAVKGTQALDESLVPIDIGDPGARYLRDHELARLLAEMVNKGLHVTIVLDSCHSGGATRGVRDAVSDVAVRGVDFIDRTERPLESLVAPREELEKSWAALGKVAPGSAATRNLATGDNRGEGYTLFAACRPGELANEAVFEGTERNGALTFWLLDTLQQLDPDMTVKMVHDRVVAKVHSRFESQVPVLQGDPGRAVFGAGQVQPEFTTLVVDVADDGKSMTLETGQALGVRAGALFVLYPRTVTDLSRPESRLALVRISQIGATTSQAELVQAYASKAIEQGDQAVLMGAASAKLVRKVRTVPNGKVLGVDQPGALLRIEQAVPDSQGWIEVAAGGEPADLVVTLSDDGRQYQICDGSGIPFVNVRPELAVDDPGSAAALVRRLVHLAKYRATQELENKDVRSPLRNKLKVTLLGTQPAFDPAEDTPKPIPFDHPGDLPRVRHGDWVFVQIENASPDDLNIAVLDLQPDWGIAQVFPVRAAFEELDSRGQLLTLPLRAWLPDDYDEGNDTLKVLATVGTADFRVLELPSLDQPIPASKGGSTRRGSVLAHLLAALGAESPRTRNVEVAVNPSEEWTAVQVVIRVVRSMTGTT